VLLYRSIAFIITRMKIGIIIAMDIEYRKMLDIFEDCGTRATEGLDEGIIEGHHIVLAHCGIGKVNAALGTLELIHQHHPDVVLSTGLAGGIGAGLQVNDIVVGRQTVYHDVWCGSGNSYGQVQGMPARYDGDPRLVETGLAVGRLPENRHRIQDGLVCTGDVFVTDGETVGKIKRHFPEGVACDMESAAIAQACHKEGVPFMSIRVISDTPGNTVSHQQQWEDFLASMSDKSFRFMRQYLSLVGRFFEKK